MRPRDVITNERPTEQSLASMSFAQRRLFFKQRNNSTLPASDTHSTQSTQEARRARIPKSRAKHPVQDHQPPPPIEDELDLYLAEPVCDIAVYKDDPIRWWRDIGQRRFPRLSYMATDYLTIPPSTCETERQFNSAGRMLSPLRNRLSRWIVSQAQSMRSWSLNGVYIPQIPLHLVDNKDWRLIVRAAGLSGLDDEVI
jgi:hAT family C-terminal dimerisation region